MITRSAIEVLLSWATMATFEEQERLAAKLLKELERRKKTGVYITSSDVDVMTDSLKLS